MHSISYPPTHSLRQTTRRAYLTTTIPYTALVPDHQYHFLPVRYAHTLPPCRVLAYAGAACVLSAIIASQRATQRSVLRSAIVQSISAVPCPVLP
eukprot:2809612-Rhodomonas_salina.4